MEHFLIYIAGAYALGILTLIHKGQRKMANTEKDILAGIEAVSGALANETGEIKAMLTNGARDQASIDAAVERLGALKVNIENMSEAVKQQADTGGAPPEGTTDTLPIEDDDPEELEDPEGDLPL